MAEAIGEGIAEAGKKAAVLEVAAADVSMLENQKGFALGASAMGAEELDGEMDNFVTEVETFANGKTIALFGSYDWGDGEWMRQWVSRMEEAGAVVLNGEGCIANLAPDEEAIQACKTLGAELAKI